MGQHCRGNITCLWVTMFIAFCKVSGSSYVQVHLQVQGFVWDIAIQISFQ